MMSFGDADSSDDPQSFVQRMCSSAFASIENKDWTLALGELEKCKEVMKRYTLDQDLVLLVHHNVACCQQK